MTARLLDQARKNYQTLVHAYDLCRGRDKLSRQDVRAIVDAGARANQLRMDIRQQLIRATGGEAYLELVDKSTLIAEVRYDDVKKRDFPSGRFDQSDESVRDKIETMVETIKANASLLARVPDLERETHIRHTKVEPRSR